jgi:hypothetical protein
LHCRTLTQGEHSFNYLGRQVIPPEVQTAWRLVGDTADRTATVSLRAVPGDAADGELFFVLSSAGTWSAEYAPQLRSTDCSTASDAMNAAGGLPTSPASPLGV